MAEIPRLNGVIKALEEGKTAFVPFSNPDIESATALGSSKYDGVVYEMEHGPYDAPTLRDTLQFMLSRRQILDSGTLAPAVTPMVRIPPNGGEMNQWIAKQALDIGVYGIVFPHVSSVDEAWNAVRACRYPRLPEAPIYNPPGIRGDAPTRAARYWGLGQQEYYARADVWPLAPQGEVLVIIQCEEVRAIDNLPAILKEVPGIGVVLIGEGDLSQELGRPPRLRTPRSPGRHHHHPQHLQGTQRSLRPPSPRRPEHGPPSRAGLPLPHAPCRPLLRPPRKRLATHRTQLGVARPLIAAKPPFRDKNSVYDSRNQTHRMPGQLAKEP